ncbi:hypothetical protein RHMOL_Rhmol02G0227100 [Rhododendron molle]|uniref:Uncharacterized protein n=1 Tax=Rhododendron molle TaxID=49168 RepID=A0ACC0PTH9_RHOML|nr:hypothetical protein RHMOL_Rhmol02G0227100 [Rhododendron molle]
MPPVHGPQGFAFAELVLAFLENLALAQRTRTSGTISALVTRPVQKNRGPVFW